MRATYVHDVWVAKEPGFEFRYYGVIKTKKLFRKTVLEWFREDPDMRVRFRLVGSPNTTLYEVVDYLPRSRRRGLLFIDVSQEQGDDSDDTPF